MTSEIAPRLQFHGPLNTTKTLDATDRIIKRLDVGSRETLIARTTALYLDMGYVVKYDDNAHIAASIAKATLPEFGYSRDECVDVALCIDAVLGKPNGLLVEHIVADAAREFVDTPDCFTMTALLYADETRYHPAPTDLQWCKRLETIVMPKYLTRAGGPAFGEWRLKHARLLNQCLAQLQ
jgi:hypothetical protein